VTRANSPELPSVVVPRGCTCFKLRRLSRTVSRLYDQELASTGLRITQYSLLKMIATEPGPLARIAEQLSLERTTLTRNLKPLIAAGLVKTSLGEDARVRVVSVTAHGRQSLEHGRVAWRRAQLQLQDVLGNDFVNDLHHTIDAALIQLQPLLDGD
jgi:DNA-binding MarR family transcriptional regulator